MGIPKFFRWLTRRYPLILQGVTGDGQDTPPADNLYLDLNSIVHNCIHGNDAAKHARMSRLEDLEDVWAEIMRAIDEIVHVVKPRKLILLAVDGVAPRAKMNQQRERRFRSAKDAAALRDQLRASGKDAPDVFDTNQISPGTKFMNELGKQLEWFVKYKLNTDPLYQACDQVIVSDASVPGEGEHKMLDFIRNARAKPGYDPNTRHCFYGSDADLIMLSLLTHEPHFFIIREEHVVSKSKHGGVQRIDIERTKNLQLIHISILREYFLLEYRVHADQMKMRFDLERVIDDFVFFCFFIGNDFLPSLSALDISEGSLDHVINFYKKCLPQMTDYITDTGQIHWDRAEPFIELLGKYEHQVFINRVKTLDQKYKDAKNIVTFDDAVNTQAKLSQQDKTSMLQQNLKAKINQKKVEKCKKLYLSHRQKKHKKFLLLKKFEELEPSDSDDDEVDTKATKLTEEQQKLLADNLKKYRKLRETQADKDAKSVEVEKLSLRDLVGDLDEAYLSDLRPDEIPNEDVSDVDEKDLQEGEQLVLEAEKSVGLESKLQMTKSTTEQAIENNHNFMRDFVNKYRTDSNEAKRDYYLAKLKFDVKEPKGKRDLHKMLYRYLEGLQWVLFYYYRGAQHWRWYYPYHYAPMISDIGSNIVADFLNNQTTIKQFRTDTNCNEDPSPYTPFQQLLCILPVKSLGNFLPTPYVDLATGPLLKYFPDDFEIDLNGRTLPWEAAILIPFVDEDVFLGAEEEITEAGTLQLTDHEAERNTISFVYPWFAFDKRADAASSGELRSTLKTFRPLPGDRSYMETCDDYASVGQASFSSALLPGVKSPQPDLPSLHWLQAQELEFRDVFVQKVAFKQGLVKIPRCSEDTSGQNFEAFIHKFAQSKLPEVYVGFPRQEEAFPLTFEDPYSIYDVRMDPNSGAINVQKLRQTKTESEFRHQAKVLCAHLESKGFAVDHEAINTFVCYNKLLDVEYDENLDAIYKRFEESADWLPLSMVMKTRDPSHFLNINERVHFAHGRIENGKDAICFNTSLFGVLGRVKSKDIRANVAKLEIDRRSEEAKVHHPFIAENFLRREFAALNADASSASKGSKKQPSAEAADAVRAAAAKRLSKKFYGDREIENVLGLAGGIVNRLTSSFLVAFDKPGEDDRQVIDLGLNLKNFTKKVHVANFVRFIAPGKAASTIYDEFQHNQGSRGSKHVRKHWEYSQECVEMIQQYVTQFPEILVAIASNQKHNKGMNSLSDVYPTLAKSDKAEAITRIRAITSWIESLPISQLPYVEMGFDALDQVLVSRLLEHSDYVAANYDTVTLQVKKVESLNTGLLYQEMHPFWFSPYLNPQTVNDFRVGNRVMNVNSTLRQYVPFGLRGTVVGKTEAHVLVVFDEQFLHGTTVYGHCEAYRGATIFPQYLLNLSRSFAAFGGPGSKDFAAIKQFQEKPLKGQAEYEDQLDADEAAKRRADGGPSLRSQHLIGVHGKPAQAKEAKNFQQKSPNQGPGEEKKASEKKEMPQKREAFNTGAASWQPKPSAQPTAMKEVGTASGQVKPARQQVWSQKSTGDKPLAEVGKKPLFAPLPGLKLADPGLKDHPEFQKIKSFEPSEEKKDKKD